MMSCLEDIMSSVPSSATTEIEQDLSSSESALVEIERDFCELEPERVQHDCFDPGSEGIRQDSSHPRLARMKKKGVKVKQILPTPESQDAETCLDTQTLREPDDSEMLAKFSSCQTVVSVEQLNGEAPSRQPASTNSYIKTRLKCPHCRKCFNKDKRLREHLETHTGDKKLRGRKSQIIIVKASSDEPVRADSYIKTRLKCPHCIKSFNKDKLLHEHLETHTGEKKLSRVMISVEPLKGEASSDEPVRPDSYIKKRLKCPHCRKRFNKGKRLREHLKTHMESSENGEKKSSAKKRQIGSLHRRARLRTKERPFSCSHCDRKFTEAERLHAHEQRHTGGMPFVCEQCDMKFASASNLLNHRRTHTGERPYMCEECGEMFRQRASLLSHQHMHSGKLKLKVTCAMCAKTFCDRHSLRYHQMAIHNGERPFVCEECGKRFVEKCHLRLHQRKHAGERPYACAECSKTFFTGAALKRHMMMHVGCLRPFACAQCDKSFPTAQQLRCHDMVHNVERRLPCMQCEKTCCSKFALRIHMLSHTGERPYQCEQCQKAFTIESNLKRHVLMHTGARPFVCAKCGKSFAHEPHMRSHELAHGVELRRTCTLCPKTFCNQSVLNKHMLTHTEGWQPPSGERPFKCAQCKKAFGSAPNLKRHETTHSRERKHLCAQCDERFVTKGQLRRHERVEHNEARWYECTQCERTYRHLPALNRHLLKEHC